jgi:hypothetical protein
MSTGSPSWAQSRRRSGSSSPGDQRIRKNLAERAAWIKAALKAFVLAPVYQKTPINQGASVLLWRWPQMKAFVEQAAPGSMFELSINRRTGFVPLAVK